MSAAKCEPGRGEGLSFRTVPELRDHPTPPLRVDPPPPGEGKRSHAVRSSNTPSHSRGAIRPSFAFKFPPSLLRAQGMPGAWCARRRMCNGRKQRAHALVRSHRKHPAFPARWFTAYFALSPAIGLFCHRRFADTSARLDASVEASGPHDFAVRVSAIRQRRVRVHRIPPRVRDDREPPLRWDGTT